MLNKFLTVLFILFLVTLLAVATWIVISLYAFGAFDKDYSLTELKSNFEKHRKEIYELRTFFEEIVPEDKLVEIEFKNNQTLSRFGIYERDSLYKKTFLEWDVEINTERTDSIIHSLGWTKETLKLLKGKLDKANCIQIENGEPTKIGFQRSGLGMYSFNLFKQPITNELKHSYNDSCRYILVNDSLALEYRGGAIGPQCFYNFK